MLRFLIANAAAIEPAQVGPLLDFVQSIRHERVAVMTLNGLVMREPPQPLFSIDGEPGRDPLLPPTVWQLMELTNGAQLRTEGAALHHCVRATLTSAGEEHLGSVTPSPARCKVRHVLTIEVDMNGAQSSRRAAGAIAGRPKAPPALAGLDRSGAAAADPLTQVSRCHWDWKVRSRGSPQASTSTPCNPEAARR